MTKSIPCLLVFAATSSLAFAQEGGTTPSWSMKPGSGLKYDGGDAFGLKWTNRLQVHWTYDSAEAFQGNRGTDTNTFNIRRMRSALSGHIFNRNLLFKIELDGVDTGSSGGSIKQGWAQWNLCNCESSLVGLRVGQSKTQFGLERSGTSGGLWFVERSSASRAFSDSFSRGAWLAGVMLDHKLRWTAAATNTDVAGGINSTNVADTGEEGANTDSKLDYTFTANFDPLGDFFGGSQTAESFQQGDFRTGEQPLVGTVGAALFLGNSPTKVPLSGAGSVTNLETTSLNFNSAWKVSGIQLLGEYFMRTDDLQDTPTPNKEESSGWAVSVGYLLPKSGDSSVQWGVGLRVNEVKTDDGNDGTVDFLTGAQGIKAGLGTVREISVVLNAFYHGHSCKTQIEYTNQDVDIDGGSAFDRTNHLVRVGFQLEF